MSVIFAELTSISSSFVLTLTPPSGGQSCDCQTPHGYLACYDATAFFEIKLVSFCHREWCGINGEHK